MCVSCRAANVGLWSSQHAPNTPCLKRSHCNHMRFYFHFDLLYYLPENHLLRPNLCLFCCCRLVEFLHSEAFLSHFNYSDACMGFLFHFKHCPLTLPDLLEYHCDFRGHKLQCIQLFSAIARYLSFVHNIAHHTFYTSTQRT